MRQIILDTETTGLSPAQGHRLIEIGCIEMMNRRMTNNHFHFYVNPQRAIDEGAIKIHGITNEFLKDKPFFADIAESLFSFLKDAELIIHNAPFDVGFLNAEFARIDQSRVPITQFCSVIDTLTIARREHPGQQNTLDALCRRYGVNNKHRDLHGALIDAALLADVYLQMTGGQTQLFGAQSSDENTIVDLKIEKMWRQSGAALSVIVADDTELFAHEILLDKIAAKGKCLWRETNKNSENP